LSANLRQQPMRSRQDAALELVLDGLEFALKAAAIDEFEQREAFVIGQREHGAKRRFEPLCIQTGSVPRTAGRSPQEAVEGNAKAAAGFEAVIELQIQYGFPLAHAGQRQAHAPRTMISVEGHAAIALERAPGGRG